MPAFRSPILPSPPQQDAKNVLNPVARPVGKVWGNRAGWFDSGVTCFGRPFLPMFQSNGLPQTPVSSGVFDLTFAFEMMVATVANAKLAH